GRDFALVRRRGGRSEVLLVHAAGGTLRPRRLFAAGTLGPIAFSPRGDWLLVDWRETGSWLFLPVGGPAGRRARQITGVGRRFGARAATPSCQPALKFKSVPFSNPTAVNNRFLPMPAGLQMTLEGRANRGGGPLPHTVVFTVTGLTKIINGVKTVVVYDIDTNEGQLQEAELAFFAQDDARNIWSLGEYPEEYDNGVFAGAPNTWIASLDGAQAGTIMLGNPQLGTAEYLQGFAPDIDFLDCATIFQRDARTCVPVKCYSDML